MENQAQDPMVQSSVAEQAEAVAAQVDAGMTDEAAMEEARVAAEKEHMDRTIEYLDAVPKFNIGALFAPPIWGPAHGWWPAILFYPVWLFCDNVFYAAFATPSTLTCVLAGIMFIIITAFTFGWSFACQFHGVQRAIELGQTKEEYAKKQKFWAVLGVVIGVAALILATYFNVMVRPGLA